MQTDSAIVYITISSYSAWVVVVSGTYSSCQLLSVYSWRPTCKAQYQKSSNWSLSAKPVILIQGYVVWPTALYGRTLSIFSWWLPQVTVTPWSTATVDTDLIVLHHTRLPVFEVCDCGLPYWSFRIATWISIAIAYSHISNVAIGVRVATFFCKLALKVS